MKKYINKVAALLVGIVMLTSCNDWLDVVQEGTIPSEDIDFTDKSLMYAPVSGVYAQARAQLSQWEIWPLLNVRGDEVTKGGGTLSDQGEYLNIENFNYDQAKGFWALNNTWVALYKLVFNTHDNQVLMDRFRENLETDADHELADAYEAEIVFHRALAYYFISNLWGDVPIIVPEDITYGIPYQPYKTSLENVREYIKVELDYCIEHLPETQFEHPGAVTRYSAMALKAKVALMNGEYELVNEITDDIINQASISLEQGENYYNLFKIPGKLASESLYELQFTDFDTGSGDQVYGGAWFEHQGPTRNEAPINGWGFILFEEDHINFLKNRGEDSRWHVSVLESDAVTPAGDLINLFQPEYQDIKAYYNGKPYVPKNQIDADRNQYGSNNNIRILRYADVLLMNAEAKLRVGGDAATPLNEVRERAGLEPISSPTEDDILDERRAELSVEWGNRFFDLVRTGKAAGTLPGFEAGRHEYLPIPLTQEDLNPNLLEPVQD